MKSIICRSAIVASIACIAVGCGRITQGHAPSVTLEAKSDRPAPRSGFGFVFDSRRSRLVLFGGADSAYVRLGDTWEWERGVWTRFAGAGPSGRSDFAMTYDSRRGCVILFGGRTAAGLTNETWEFNGSAWTRRDTAGPTPRNLTAMAFDERRGRAILFGGSGGARRDSLTWEWDGRRWQSFPAQQDGPKARSSLALVYDSDRQRVVTVGGYIDDAVADSWEWDGATWSRVADGPRLLHAAAAFSPNDHSLFVFGGLDPDKRSSKLWRRVDGTWRLEAGPGPEERAELRGTFASGIGFVIFGGIAGQGMSLEERARSKRNDLWAYDGHGWTELGPVRK